MSDSFITVAPTPVPPGENLQTFENSIAGSDVHAEAVVLVDEFGTPLLTFEAGGGAKLLEVKITDPVLNVQNPFLASNLLVSIPDGFDGGGGETTDPAVSTDANGTRNAHIRGLLKLWNDGPPLTDAELRATPVPISGSFSLPTGAATEAKQDAEIATLGVTTGVAVTSDVDGTLQQYLRGLVKQNAGLISPSLSNIEGRIGSLTDPAPATDTASAALNGRLQRIAQRLTSLIALLPSSLGGKTAALSLSVTTATDDPELTLIGSVTETAPASDTASSGLNGRLQRIAQRITSFIALLPTSLGQKTMANSLAVTIASDQSAIPVSGSLGTKGATNVSVLRGTASASAATLAIARATRTGILIRNLDAAITIYVRDATVTTANGFPLLPGESAPFSWVGLIQVIAASGTPAYAAWDEYN